ncbi:site-specific DNA-methyltransferase [Acinetobacter albensis]|uniref:site-specific DNA-methyltransferase n=1 Tax=Acinetobacter albensis TaxID=1673609 RepID=UPI001D0E6A7B|nr:site-specific DNA-methyltransferase [Acinetobacter albensis]
MLISDHLKMHTPNLVDANIEKISALFPNCITETKDENGDLKKVVDFDLLKQELSQVLVEGEQERYRLDWVGKKEAILTANAPIAKTLRPCREESVNFDKTENLFIEGDNLEALKLLQENYLGKVKMIYIDPPYNTGNDFIYEDDFAESTNVFFEKSNQIDEEGNRLIANTESNGRFHSDWLSMMYSRLKLARNLLKDDGVLFLSINNYEVSNCQKICNEIFGEKNFIECITWNKRIPKNDKGIGNIHEFVLIYAKNSEIKQEFTMRKDGLEDIYSLLTDLKKNNTPLLEAEKQIKKLYKKNAYDRGITLYNSLNKEYKLWGKINMSWPNANTFGPRYEVLHPKTKKAVKIPERGWRWKKETFNEAAQYINGEYSSIEELHDGSFLCGRIWFSKDENIQPSSVTFLDDVNYFLLRSIQSLKSDGGIEVENIFGGKNYFSYPKPTSLLKILINSINCDNEIILDFFAGSSTTAHAIIELNSEDNKKRKFIMVQLPEKTPTDSLANQNGFFDLAQISRERIKRVGEKYININTLDVGFRSLKIDSTNMKDVYYTPDALKQADMLDLASNIKDDRTSEDLLFQVMLDWGLELSLPIERKNIAGKEVFYVAGNSLVACFDDLTFDVVDEVAKDHPLRFVSAEKAIHLDHDKTNIKERFKQLSRDTEVKFI